MLKLSMPKFDMLRFGMLRFGMFRFDMRERRTTGSAHIRTVPLRCRSVRIRLPSQARERRTPQNGDAAKPLPAFDRPATP
jgi:hypothetical protein